MLRRCLAVGCQVVWQKNRYISALLSWPALYISGWLADTVQHQIGQGKNTVFGYFAIVARRGIVIRRRTPFGAKVSGFCVNVSTVPILMFQRCFYNKPFKRTLKLFVGCLLRNFKQPTNNFSSLQAALSGAA